MISTRSLATGAHFAVAACLCTALTACTDAPMGPTATPASSKPVAETPVGGALGRPPVAVDLPRLTGGGVLTEYKFRAPEQTLHGFTTSLLASNGAVVDAPNGKCCRVLGDTLLQIQYDGAITVGKFKMDRIDIEIPEEPYAFGKSDVLLIVQRDRETEFFVPETPPTLEIVSYTAPTPTSAGEIRGRIAFEARGYLQQRSLHGMTVTITPMEGTRSITAAFISPMRYQFLDFGFDGT